MASSSDDGCLEDSRKEEIAFMPNDSAPSRKVSYVSRLETGLYNLADLSGII